MTTAKGHDPRAIANLLLDLADEVGIPIGHVKLQKLIYFAHGVYLLEIGEPLVSGNFEAWQYGPVHPAVYRHSRELEQRESTSEAKKRMYSPGTWRSCLPRPIPSPGMF